MLEGTTWLITAYLFPISTKMSAFITAMALRKTLRNTSTLANAARSRIEILDNATTSF